MTRVCALNPNSFLVVAFAVLLGSCALATAQPLKPSEGSHFRVATNLILIPVTVMDARGAIINGLDKEHFTILDDRQPQAITAFYAEDAPCSVGIVLDISGSMKDKLDLEKAAVHTFLESSNPEDNFFLLTVSSSPTVLSRPVNDPGAIEEIVRSEVAGGSTALYDTIYFALDRARLQRKARRALLVISDGMDNHSRYTKQDLMRFAVESDAQIYTIAFDDSRSTMKAIQLSGVQRGLAFLDDLAERTGGLSIRVKEFDNLSAAAGKISRALRNRYVIGFETPDTDGSEKWHKVQVKVNLQKVNVYARRGYRSR